MPRDKRLTSKRFGSQRRRGAALVEAALVLPLTVLFILSIFEFCRYLMHLHVLTNAAATGARYALTHTQPITIVGTTGGNTTSDVVEAITNASGGVALANQDIQVYRSDAVGNNLGSWNDAQFGQSICVRITGDFHVIGTTLLGLPATLPIRVQSVMRSEAN